MKSRVFEESPLFPITKQEINGYFKQMWLDVKDILEEFENKILGMYDIGEVRSRFQDLEQKIQDYFNSVKIK